MNSPIEIISVLIVDDHSLIRTSIKGLLQGNKHIRVVGEAVTGEEAIQLTRELHPDVVLMDVFMPGIGGIAAANTITNLRPKSQVIVLTASSSLTLSAHLLKSGVFGYLTKNCSQDELTTAIKQVYQGNRYLSASIAKSLANIALTEHETSSFFYHLSNKDMQIVLMLIQGMSIKSIASSLHLSPKTIGNYRYHIHQKLAVTNDVELLFLAIKEGIIEPL